MKQDWCKTGGEGGRVLYMQQVASFGNLLPQTAVDSIKRFKQDYTD